MAENRRYSPQEAQEIIRRLFRTADLLSKATPRWCRAQILREKHASRDSRYRDAIRPPRRAYSGDNHAKT